jgi:hypothetical protein
MAPVASNRVSTGRSGLTDKRAARAFGIGGSGRITGRQGWPTQVGMLGLLLRTMLGMTPDAFA